MAPSRSRWRTFTLLITILVSFQAGVVDAIVATYCSSENTSDGPATHDDLQSEGACRDTCSIYADQTYAFSITQGKNCWCSDIAPGDTTSLSDCDFKCVGFPFEFCGAPGAGLYNYLALGPKPKGTDAGGGAPGPLSTSSPATSVPGSPSETTIYDTVPQTIYKTETIKTTKHGSVITESPRVKTVTTSVVTRRPLPSAPSSSSAVVISEVIVSTQVLTLNGQATTRFIASPLPTAPSSSNPPETLTETHSGLSGGAIAGIVIGVLAAIAIIAASIYFCCWRPRRRHSDDYGEQGRLNGNRTGGLLGGGGFKRDRSGGNVRPSSSGMSASAGATAAAVAAAAGSSSRISSKPPRLQTDIPNVSGGPSSAATGGTMMSRRDSRPIFVDQRLNPNAVMTSDNPSQASFATLHDDEDYSRPLEVRNPDR